MAQPTNLYSSYDQVGIREDISDVINNVSPSDTPFYSSCAKTKATNTYHEWQTESYRSSGANAQIEGDDKTARARTPTVRLGNYTQILDDTIAISGTDEALKKAGRGDEMDHQIIKAGVEVRLDVEAALLLNNARVAGNDSTARELAGAPVWLTSNTSSGVGGSDAAGDGSNARTNGTQRALTQAIFDKVLQSIWENSSGRASLTCLLNAFQMNKALGFTGNNNQRAQISAEKNAVRNVIDIYMTPWGTVEFVGSREIAAREILMLDMSKWKVAVARPFWDKPLAKTGDSEKRYIGTELTLEACNEASSGGVFDLTVS